MGIRTMESIGSYLKSKRETYGLTLDDIYARTKIRHHVIEQIENDNFSVMPAPYLKSFLRTYCDMVGIEPDEAQQLISRVGLPSKPVVQQAVQTPAAEQKPAETVRPNKPTPPKAERSVKPLLIRGFVYAGIFLGIVILAYEFVFKPDPSKKSQSPQKNDTSLLTVVGNTVVGIIDESVANDSLVLEFKANDQVWLTLTADGKFSRQLVLNPQEKRSWSAKEFFTLSVSNAGALEITRNGKPLPQLGAMGEFVRSIKITKDELITSASPYNKQVSSSSTPSPQQQQTTAITPKPKPTVEQTVPTQKPTMSVPQKNMTQQATIPKATQQPKPLPKEQPPIIKEKSVVKNQQNQQAPAKNVVSTPKPTIQQKPAEVQKPTATKQAEKDKKENTPKPVKEKEQKQELTKAEKRALREAEKEQKEREKKARRRRGTLEIEEVPLRPIEQGLPTQKPQPKQIPPDK